MKPLALVTAALWSAAFPAAPDSGLVWNHFADARVAYTVRIPPGWHATVHYGATIVTSVRVADIYANPERIRLHRGGVYVWLFDYGPVGRDADLFPEQPDRLVLGEKQAHSCGFGEGYMLHFRAGGRGLQAFVKLGPFTSGRDALAVLNSLDVTDSSRRATPVPVMAGA